MDTTNKTFRKRTKELYLLLDKGIEKGHALTLVYGDSIPSDRQVRNLMANYRELSLTRPETVIEAHNAVHDALKLKPITRKGEVILPNYTHKLQAAKMVLDRAEPIVNINHNTTVTAHLTPVDLEAYKTVDID